MLSPGEGAHPDCGVLVSRRDFGYAVAGLNTSGIQYTMVICSTGAVELLDWGMAGIGLLKQGKVGQYNTDIGSPGVVELLDSGMTGVGLLKSCLSGSTPQSCL